MDEIKVDQKIYNKLNTKKMTVKNQKICSKCKITKLHNEFNKDKSKKDGLQSQCRNCQKDARSKNKRQFQNLTKDVVPTNNLFNEEETIDTKNKPFYFVQQKIIAEKSQFGNVAKHYVIKELESNNPNDYLDKIKRFIKIRFPEWTKKFKKIKIQRSQNASALNKPYNQHS